MTSVSLVGCLSWYIILPTCQIFLPILGVGGGWFLWFPNGNITIVLLGGGGGGADPMRPVWAGNVSEGAHYSLFSRAQLAPPTYILHK